MRTPVRCEPRRANSEAVRSPSFAAAKREANESPAVASILSCNAKVFREVRLISFFELIDKTVKIF